MSVQLFFLLFSFSLWLETVLKKIVLQRYKKYQGCTLFFWPQATPSFSLFFLSCFLFFFAMCVCQSKVDRLLLGRHCPHCACVKCFFFFSIDVLVAARVSPSSQGWGNDCVPACSFPVGNSHKQQSGVSITRGVSVPCVPEAFCTVNFTFFFFFLLF